MPGAAGAERHREGRSDFVVLSEDPPGARLAQKRRGTLRRSRSSERIPRIEHPADAPSATDLSRRFDGKEE